jgi:hypothetical protein
VGSGNSRIRGATDEEQWYRKGKTKTIDMQKMCKSCACVEEGVCRVLHVCCGAVGNEAVSTGALPVIAHLGTHTHRIKGKVYEMTWFFYDLYSECMEMDEVF